MPYETNYYYLWIQDIKKKFDWHLLSSHYRPPFLIYISHAAPLQVYICCSTGQTKDWALNNLLAGVFPGWFGCQMAQSFNNRCNKLWRNTTRFFCTTANNTQMQPHTSYIILERQLLPLVDKVMKIWRNIRDPEVLELSSSRIQFAIVHNMLMYKALRPKIQMIELVSSSVNQTLINGSLLENLQPAKS